MKQLLRVAIVLGLLASIYSILPLPKSFAQSQGSNPPVPCECECYKLDDATVSVNGSSSAPWTQINIGKSTVVEKECVPAVVDSEGKIKIYVNITPWLWTPTEECCKNLEILIKLKDAKGKTATFSSSYFEIVANEWTLPIEVRVFFKKYGATSDPETPCLKFDICSPCNSCTSGTCDVKTSNGSVKFSVPVGASNFGDISPSIEAHFDTLPNPGRSSLSVLAPYTTTVSMSGGGLSSVTTSSVSAEITPYTVNDPNGYVIKLSSDPSNPSTTVFRTVHVETTVNTTTTKNLKLTDTYQGGAPIVSEWTRTEPSAGVVNWVFTKGNGLAKTDLTNTEVDASTRERRIKYYEKDAGGAYVLLSDRKMTYTLQAWGWELTQEAADPDSANLLSNWSYYQTGVGAGFLQHLDRHDGYYEDHTYVLSGTMNHVVLSPFTDGDVSSGHVLTKTNSWDSSTATVTETESLGSNTLSKKVTTYGTNSNTVKTYSDSTHYTTTTTNYVAAGTSGLGGKSSSVVHADGTLTTYAYGTSGSDRTITVSTGAASGGSVVEGSQTIGRVSPRGQTLESKTTAVGTGSGTILAHWLSAAEDFLGRPTSVQYFPLNSGGPAWTTSTTYGCCGVTSETDRYGITTSYTYDDLKRRITETRLGIIMQTVYDGLTTRTKRSDGTTNSEVGRTVRNLAGTSVESWGPSPQSGNLEKLSTTVTTYQPAAGIGRRETTTVIQVADDGGVNKSQVTDSYLDGRTFKSTGDLSPGVQYDYAINTTGLLKTRSYLDGATLRESATTQADWAGRTTQTALGTATMTHAYDDAGGSPTGRLLSVTDADSVKTLYGYNSKGERITRALDLNGNGTIDTATDQITTTESVPGSYTPSGGAATSVLTTTTQIYATSGSSTATTVSTTHRTPDGLQSWSISPGYSTASSSVVSVVTNSVTAFTGVGDWKETTTRPDGTRSIAIYTDGLLDKVEQRDDTTTPGALIASTTYGYDSLHRAITSTDSRTSTGGVTTTAYVSAISDVAASVTTASGATAFTYDHRARRLTTTLPDSTVTSASYYPDGKVKASWGSQSYPTYTTYDYADRIKTLRTNPTLSSGVPTNAGGSVTTWNYSTTTGWPTSKLDNAGDGPTFTHTNAGRQSTRTWDRGKHTIYDYVNGRQVAVRHLVASGGASDADTPDVGIIYTRTGQPQRMVTSSTANLPGTSIEYTFGAPGLNITQETTQIDPDLTFSVGGSGVTVTAGTVAASIERLLDRKTDSLLRYTGADLRKPDTTLVVGQTLAYHADSGRLDTVTGNLNGTNRVFTYGYQTNSYGLIASVTGPVHTVTNTWEGTRDVLDKKENKVGATNISTYDYSVNSIGQRSAVDVSGSAFGTQADWNWGYDSLGQVVSAQHVNTGASSRHYTFDNIGNRTQHREGGHTSSTGTPTNYTPTALNQYSAVASLGPTYDSDGNMTSGPIPNAPTVLAALAWDGENRQLSVTPNGGSTTTYLRDAMGRRVAKTTGTTRTYLLYDGWNIVAEYTGTVHTTGTPPALTLERTNVWGTDLSGSQQGAGGVGGLLATYLHNAGGDSGVYYPTYDGNGNVSEYLNGSGSVQAHFEYDPFGNMLVNTDTNSYFPIRFSTKYLDFESGMIHYGFRDYESFTGRWPNHDPIEEKGGRNLYGMMGNDGANRWDKLGLYYRPLLPIFTNPLTMNPVQAGVGVALYFYGIGTPIGIASSEYLFPPLTPEDRPCVKPLDYTPRGSGALEPWQERNVQDWIAEAQTEVERLDRALKAGTCRNISAKYDRFKKLASRIAGSMGCGYKNCGDCDKLLALYKALKNEVEGRKEYQKLDCDEIPWNKPQPNKDHAGDLKSKQDWLDRVRAAAAAKGTCDMSLFQ
jgi:RHS repeat-associated protein